MAWAPTQEVVLGCLAFAVWWVLAVFPAVPFMPIGRTAGSLVGAALMVVFQVISPTAAFAAVDLPILGLLFGTMVISVYLERADLFRYLGNALSWRTLGGKDLLCRVSLLAAISSALFTNDTTCVVLTGFVLKLCKEKNLPPQPFLLALASSSNIGSSATPIGNPQNLVIAVQSGLGFGKFLIGILPAMAVGLVVNTVGLLLVYWRSLSRTRPLDEGPIETVLPHTGFENKGALQNGHVRVDILSNVSSAPSMGYVSEDCEENHLAQYRALNQDGLVMRRPTHAPLNGPDTQRQNSDVEGGETPDQIGTGEVPEVGLNPLHGAVTPGLPGADRRTSMSLPRHGGPQPDGMDASFEGTNHIDTAGSAFPSSGGEGNNTALSRGGKISRMLSQKWKRRIWKICVYLVAIGMLAALLAGLSLPWSAITAAVVLMVLDFSDAGPSLDKVSYSLLVFFAGMFITVAGFNATGAPGQLWSAVEPHARINSVSGLSVLALVVTVLSNAASNVPTVLLLGQRVAASAAATPGVSVAKAWLILAWVSTVAGNLTLVGSAANLIVCEQARRTSGIGYNLSFWNHLRYGFPSTLIVIAVGLPLIRG